MSLILSGTNGLSDVDGSAATPAIRGTDTNTGIFFPAADTIAFAEGGVEAMRLDSSGNMGLGVTPSAWGDIKAVELANGVALGAYSAAAIPNMYLGANCFFNGSNWIYKVSSYRATRYLQASSGEHQWFNSASGTAGNAITFTQAMTLDASGNLGIGATSPGARLQVDGTAGNTLIRINRTDSTSARGALQWTGSDGVVDWQIGTNMVASGGLEFSTAQTSNVLMTLDTSGNLLVGTTSTARTSNGIKLLPGTDDGTVSITNARSSGGNPIELNRQVSDGTLIAFYQADTLEGTISVSGTTVSYNGGHLARYAQTTTAKDEALKKGTVLSNLDEMNTYTDAEGNVVDNEQLNKVKVSDVEGDANVAGVFVNWSHDEDHNVDEINMAMTGDMIIRIAQGTTVARGDLLMSAGDGTAKPQGDDIVRAKTVAKVTSTHVTCTYEDGSYCVPCVLMAY